MADEQQLARALRRAHDAGDTEAARRLARAIQAGRAAAPAAMPAKTVEELTPGISIDPTEGNSFLQNAMIGAGKSVADTGRGLAQLVGQGPSRAQVDETRQLEAPVMAKAGGVVGNVAGQVAQAFIPVGGAARLASYAGKAAPFVRAAIQGAALSGAQNVGTDESRLANVGTGAALGAVGQGIASGAGRLAAGAVSRLDDASAALARKAENVGIRLGAGELTENSLFRTAISQLERLPFSGGGARAAANQSAFVRRISNEIGEDADKITPDVFSRAKQRISGEFERLSGGSDLAPTPELTGQLAQLTDEASRLAGTDTARMVKGWVNELVQKAGPDGMIPGKAYQSFDSRLGNVIKTGGEPAYYLGALRDAVRKAMDDSIATADKAAWQTARQQYAALKTIEPLIAKSPTGNISPAQLMGVVTASKAAKARKASGRSGALGDLADIGQRFLKEPPNTGTADRALVNAAAAGGGAGLLSYLSPTAAITTGSLLAGNRGLLKLLNSRALTQGDSKTLKALAKAARVAPRALPAAGMAGTTPAFNIGTAYGLDPNDPRYRGD